MSISYINVYIINSFEVLSRGKVFRKVPGRGCPVGPAVKPVVKPGNPVVPAERKSYIIKTKC